MNEPQPNSLAPADSTKSKGTVWRLMTPRRSSRKFSTSRSKKPPCGVSHPTIEEALIHAQLNLGIRNEKLELLKELKFATLTIYPLGEPIPPSQGESPFPVDFYLSWTSPSFPPGLFFLLEDCDRVKIPVHNREPYFKVDPAFDRASYSKRYELLARRLVLERVYTSACLVMSTNPRKTIITQPADDLSSKRFVAALRAHVVTFMGSRKK
jgi:restriction endonuclease XhoI-like protein